MTPESVKEYFSQSPQGAQLLIDNQRELAHKFGPPSIAFQDWVGVQVKSHACHSIHAGSAKLDFTMGAPLLNNQPFLRVVEFFQEQKVAFWVSKKAALQACSSQNIFCPAPDGGQQTVPIGPFNSYVFGATSPLSRTSYDTTEKHWILPLQ